MNDRRVDWLTLVWASSFGCLAVLFVVQLAARSSASATDFAQRAEEALTAEEIPTFRIYLSLECENCEQGWQTVFKVRQMPNAPIRLVPALVPASQSVSDIEQVLGAECSSIEGRFWDYIGVVINESPSDLAASAEMAGIQNLEDHLACIRDRRFLYVLDERAKLVESRSLPFVAQVLHGQLVTMDVDTIMTIAEAREP